MLNIGNRRILSATSLRMMGNFSPAMKIRRKTSSISTIAFWGKHWNGMSRLTWRLWAYPNMTCLSWKHQSQKRKFGKLLALSLQTKLQSQMASLETFIKPAGL
jgi:hypothetical protein